MKKIVISNGSAAATPSGALIPKQWSAARRACALAAVIPRLAANLLAGTETALHTWVDTTTNEDGGSLAGLAMDAKEIYMAPPLAPAPAAWDAGLSLN